MDILQLGPANWADRYQMPKDMKWEFNKFPSKKEHHYDLVLVTGRNQLTDKDWQDLQWLVDPYHVLYLASNNKELSNAAHHFLKCQEASPIQDDPQTVIHFLPRRYFFGQSGIRILPTTLIPLMDRIKSYEVLDSGHLLMEVDTNNNWEVIGTYQAPIYIDPDKIIKFWLAYQAKGLAVHLKIFMQPYAADGDPKDSFELDVSSSKELQLPIKVISAARFATICLKVKGKGSLNLGILHSRWGRDGVGEFIAGGHRIVDLKNGEDVAYFFNPGDLRPPLNVYFAGARGLEGFEAFPLFRSFKAPSLLFTDMRLEVGQFYTGAKIQQEMKKVIQHYLQELNFDNSKLIMNGISMGTYPAIKLGAELSAYAINVAKPLGDLGLIAKRGRLQRPDEFDTIFDIDNQIVRRLDQQNLTLLDKNFWDSFNKCDLSKTRLFVGYMKDDDYDNQAIHYFQKSPAVANAREFSSYGFGGHHNDNPQVNNWFINRLHQMLVRDFGRKG